MTAPNQHSSHEHGWSLLNRSEHCHYVRTIDSCECGANRETYEERSVWKDPHSETWMVSDDGSAPRCKRCAELLAGVEPLRRANIVYTGAA